MPWDTFWGYTGSNLLTNCTEMLEVKKDTVTSPTIARKASDENQDLKEKQISHVILWIMLTLVSFNIQYHGWIFVENQTTPQNKYLFSC